MEDYEVQLDLEEMSYYQPKYNLNGLLEYSEALDLVREAQKELIRNKEVLVSGNGNQPKREISKLAVSAFNGEATNIISEITYSNYEKSKEKLRIAFNKVNNLLIDTGMAMSSSYLDLKLKEMALVYDLKEKEQLVKQEQIELKEQMREEEKARIEAERVREKAIQEQERYQKALEQVRYELASKSDEERAGFESQIQDLQRKLDDATAERERATSMAQITKRGHVYIISNVGSFGENVYKIGMTRRQKPEDRIMELGDASVPFGFDIHAMVLTEDAPALENALHREFDPRRVNKVNFRKEFFRTSIEDIANACEKLGYKIQLTILAEAREYRATLDKGSS